MLDRRHFIALGATSALGSLGACTSLGTGGWITLLDGATLTNAAAWKSVGTPNWSAYEGSLQGKAGVGGFMVSPDTYTDFELKSEFWADEDCNSGIFMRCQDRATITADNAYEVNIFDKRPDPSYGTAAIVNVAKIPQPGPKAANRWNTFEVSARGDRMVVVFNGQQTVDVRDAKFKSGPIALQSAGGTIRFRSLKLRIVG